jgi:hypothetical protein
LKPAAGRFSWIKGKKVKLIFFAFIIFVAIPVLAADTHVSGTISNISGRTDGLLIMIDPDRKVPDNCTGTPYNWMLIPEDEKTMISVALTVWTMGRGATVYTNTRTSGYCIVNQIDPFEE